MSFGEFVNSLAARLSSTPALARNLVLCTRDEILAQLAAGEEVTIPKLGMFQVVLTNRRTCASHLPGQRGKKHKVRRSRRVRFAVYSSAQAEVDRIRSKLVAGDVTAGRKKGRAVSMGKKKGRKLAGRSIEVSIPADVSEVVIKIDKSGKKAESQSRRKLLG